MNMEDAVALVVFLISIIGFWSILFIKLKNILNGFEDYRLGTSVVMSLIAFVLFGFGFIVMLQYPVMLNAILVASMSFMGVFIALLTLIEMWYCRGDWKDLFKGLTALERR